MLKQPKAVKETQNKIGKMLSMIPISPNQWTLLSLVIAGIGAYQITQNDLYFGLILFAFAAACDLVDGAVARARNEVSKMGGFIDGVCDRFVEALFLFAFMFYPLPVIFIDTKIWLASLIFLGTSMPSFIRAYADHKEVISKEKANKLGGICERSERLLVILIGLGVGLVQTNLNYFVYSVIIASCLSSITIMQRLWWIGKEKN
ncbi:MAG: CDP-alcohol phosphatidyltransferase family protein [Candidatus Bilamarchaeum sp.]|jgi:phosphatidylglycerophosphate synthase